MKAEFEQYLKSIGMTETFRKRVKTIYAFYVQICPDEIMDIFVADYIKEDGTREYQNLWFFSPKCCMEAHSFRITDQFDMYAIRRRVYYWKIEKQDYDFKKATAKSRLHLTFNMHHGVVGDIKAAKENCDYLKTMILKYVVPNFSIECEKS